MANFSYVIDSSFQPFSMQEMLVPFTAYKEAYEKDEERYLNLQEKAGDLEAVINTLPEGSNVRKQYENYYNELKKSAADFSSNGKTMLNSRALLDLRRRYQGEIGSIEKANNALNEELKLRRNIMAQDPTMIYNNDNPTLENYMPGAKRNDYSISGNFLASEGAKMGEAISKRKFTAEDGSTNILGGYYVDFVQRTGIQDVNAFMKSDEFKNAMIDDLRAKGVYDNLSGNNLQRAIDSYRSGVMKGIVYAEQHNPQRDLGKPTEVERQQLEMQKSSQELSALGAGYKKDANGNWVDDPNSYAYKQKKIAEHSGQIIEDPNNPGTYIVNPLFKSINVEPEDPKKLEKIKISKKGHRKALGTSDDYGVSITYDDMEKNYPEYKEAIDNEISKEERKYYRFYINDNDGDGYVYLIPKTGTVKGSSDVTSPTNSSSDENQVPRQ